jgi:hypothetical protein
MSPRPEYKDAAKKTIYAEVEPDVKDKLGDIAYSLDLAEKDALATVIRDYHEQKQIKPRPSRALKK